MPFIPNETFKVGEWVYLKNPVRIPTGTFTAGTRVLIVSADECGLHEFRDEHGNTAGDTPASCFTKELE
jgi:hypothetical protein